MKCHPLQCGASLSHWGRGGQGGGLTLCCHILGLPAPNNTLSVIIFWCLKMTVTASLYARSVHSNRGERECIHSPRLNNSQKYLPVLERRNYDVNQNKCNVHGIHVLDPELQLILFFNSLFGYGLSLHHILNVISVIKANESSYMFYVSNRIQPLNNNNNNRKQYMNYYLSGCH